MKWWAVLIIVILIGGGAFTGGYFYGKRDCPQIAAVADETPTTNKSVTPPPDVNLSWYITAYKSPVKIDGKFRDDNPSWFDVRATDTYKTAYKSFKLTFPVRERRISILIMPFIFGGRNSELKRTDILGGGQLLVLRNYGFYSAGGAGIYAYNFMSKDHYGGAGAVFGFNP